MGLSFKDLPYHFNSSPRIAVVELARHLDIPEQLVPLSDIEKVSGALAGLALYRHSGPLEKRHILESWEFFSSSDRPFFGALHSKLANILINPKWEVWSLTREELIEIYEYHKGWLEIGAVGGRLNPGSLGVAEAILGASTKLGLVTFAVTAILYGLWKGSEKAFNDAEHELESRTSRSFANPGAKYQ